MTIINLAGGDVPTGTFVPQYFVTAPTQDACVSMCIAAGYQYADDQGAVTTTQTYSDQTQAAIPYGLSVADCILQGKDLTATFTRTVTNYTMVGGVINDPATNDSSLN